MTAHLRSRAQELAAVLRRVVGAPDYDRYVAHMHAHHAGEPVMSREAFVRTRLEDRYSRPGARCC